MYTADVSPDRHYHLQSEDANRRIDALLEGPVRYGAEDLRHVRMVEAVEAIGTSEARALLKTWGIGSGLLARTAQGALARLNTRPKAPAAAEPAPKPNRGGGM